MCKQGSISIGTVSGGIVNFGGAINISPISITKTITGSGGSNPGLDITIKSTDSSLKKAMKMKRTFS